MEGIVFDIVRNSFVDGPGVRTTVFFKGCNLVCRWCHNPESQKKERELLFYKNKCKECGKCREVCPNTLTSCTLCGRCETYCPQDARKISGKKMTAEEVFAAVVKDKMFYEASGGGVTFSGGECMLQIDFLTELLALCKEAGIHTAVDTAGNVPWGYFERILPNTDMFLYDVKCVSEELHKSGTDVSNRLILDNLHKLAGTFSGEITIRVPVIGGFNDTDAEMAKIAALLSRIPSQVELLPYHRMGEHKYEALGRTAELFSIPNEADMTRFKEMMAR